MSSLRVVKQLSSSSSPSSSLLKTTTRITLSSRRYYSHRQTNYLSTLGYEHTSQNGDFNKSIFLTKTRRSKSSSYTKMMMERKMRWMSTDASAIADVCDKYALKSTFPPIPSPPYTPLTEFISTNWHTTNLNKTAIIDGTTHQSRTFDDYETLTTTLIHNFTNQLNIDSTSTVSIFLPNHVDYLPISLAVASCGAKLVPINPLFTKYELGIILKRSMTDVVIAFEGNVNVVLDALGDLEQDVKVVVVPSGDDGGMVLPEGTMNFDDLKVLKDESLLQQGRSESVIREGETTKSHAVLLPYSSGTTGLPKGVCLSHENLIANLWQMKECEAPFFPSDHKLISPLPFFHIYGFVASVLYCAWEQQTLITFSGRFDLETFCQIVQTHQPQRAHLVPPILLGLAKSPLVDQYDLSSIRCILSAAAPLGKEIEDDVVQRLGCTVKQAWGMSELSPLGTLQRDDAVRKGSVGLVVGGTEGKVVDVKSGRSLGPGESGELMIKGPQVMMGYLNDTQKTSESLSQNGWLRTGDVAHYDEDGYFFITDRLKELIKVRGYQVAPAELEALLLTHDDVRDVAVIGIPDQHSGELPRAYVVLKEGVEEDEEGIMEWVKERVSPSKRLGDVRFVEEVPKSASGKILRRILRDAVHEEEENKKEKK